MYIQTPWYHGIYRWSCSIKYKHEYWNALPIGAVAYRGGVMVIVTFCDSARSSILTSADRPPLQVRTAKMPVCILVQYAFNACMPLSAADKAACFNTLSVKNK